MGNKSLQDMINDKQRGAGGAGGAGRDNFGDLSKNLSKFKNMSKEQLLSEIMEMKKTAGNIDDKTLNEFKQLLSPMLNREQLSKLNYIIDNLK